ncbi:MAG: radical SAM family heme chaperone HemW [Acidobacteria bacterium]|nr:radical SAM family heme chaperone HemW [Acidobacteriota bacterium]
MAGVYISWPFCAQKCTYCNFASGVFPKALEGEYVDALIREIRAAEWRWTPDTLYIGGGTPSLIDHETLDRLLRELPGNPWAEATLEAAPGALAPISPHFNRVSLGAQSFVDAELRRTGRKHTAAIVEENVAQMRAQGIANFNIDLIAGLPGQTAGSWETSLEWVARLDPPHVSVYMLEVDEDSRLGLEILNDGPRYGARDVPADEAIVAMYERATERLQELGIERYEISNFAKPGFESKHNLKYWRLEPYIGFGADAHSFDNCSRWRNVETAAAYAAAADPSIEITRANPDEERFFVGLRLREGIEPSPSEWLAHEPAITRFLNQGLFEKDGPRLRLSPRGILLSNEIFQEFLAA